MVDIISNNIVSPLGFCTLHNYTAAKAGCSVVKQYNNLLDSGVDTSASVIDSKMLDDAFTDYCSLDPANYSKVEKAAMLSIKTAADNCDVELKSSRTAFYMSSTKGNVELLDRGEKYFNSPEIPLWHTASVIANYFGNPNTPITVSNACISGLSAIISAARALESKRIDCAVVTGVDMLSRFIVLGFSSLKSLSQSQCRPFDINRTGLNLGEAAATVILRRSEENSKFVKFVIGSIHNDAYHISSPSKTAEGSFRCLTDVTKNIDLSQIAFINAHGTSTMYNDEMESVAISRAVLQNTPVNSLKPIFGHTLGAAGVLESVISITALQDNTVLPTINFEEYGVSKKINIQRSIEKTDKQCAIKLISGFGGCNAAAVFKKGE